MRQPRADADTHPRAADRDCRADGDCNAGSTNRNAFQHTNPATNPEAVNHANGASDSGISHRGEGHRQLPHDC